VKGRFDDQFFHTSPRVDRGSRVLDQAERQLDAASATNRELPIDTAQADLFRKAAAAQRERWIAFLARMIAHDILQHDAVREDGTP